MTKHIYGTTHAKKWPYVKQVFDKFEIHLKTARTLSNDNQINNLIVDIRNEMVSLIDEIYQQLSLQLKHDLSITPTKREPRVFPEPTVIRSCMICGEKRVVARCHLIPREDGGSNLEDNMIYLCPNHHFLFDQARLTEAEFTKIDVSAKALDSIAYFQRLHRVRHQMYWRYTTNKSEGCTCGSLDLHFDAIQNGNFVEPCLVCDKCQERWFLGVNHPLRHELAIKLYEIGDAFEPTDLETRISKAKEQVRARLATTLPKITDSLAYLSSSN